MSCHYCDNDKIKFICGGCQQRTYCSSECGRIDRKKHARFCGTLQQYISGNVRVPKPVLVTLIDELIKKQDIKSIHELLRVHKNAKTILDTQFGGWKGIIMQTYQLFSDHEDVLDKMVDIKTIFDEYWDDDDWGDKELQTMKAKDWKAYARLENEDLYHYLAMQLYFMVENAAQNWIADHLHNWKYAKRKGWSPSTAKHLYGSRFVITPDQDLPTQTEPYVWDFMKDRDSTRGLDFVDQKYRNLAYGIKHLLFYGDQPEPVDIWDVEEQVEQNDALYFFWRRAGKRKMFYE